MIRFSADLPTGKVVIRVPELVISIGRDSTNIIVLNDPTISSMHARISWTGSAYRIEDMGSSNGIWIDGKAVSEAWISRSLTCFLGAIRCVLEIADPCFSCSDMSRLLMASPMITVGRAADNNWILSCPSVSSHHLRLFLEGEQMFARNLSNQGTRIGGLLFDETPIAVGDLLQVGEETILYEISPLVDDGFYFKSALAENAQQGARFRIVGSLGLDQADEFAERLGGLLRGNEKRLDLDLSACRKLHPRCLDVLLEAAQAFDAAGGRLRLVAPSQTVMRAVMLANADRRLIVVN